MEHLNIDMSLYIKYFSWTKRMGFQVHNRGYTNHRLKKEETLCKFCETLEIIQKHSTDCKYLSGRHQYMKTSLKKTLLLFSCLLNWHIYLKWSFMSQDLNT